MATSGSSDYSLNARQIATAALELVGVVAVGDEPEANDAAKALEQLNLMVKTWGADPDPKLWLITEGSQALTASTANYVFSAARKVISARRRTSNIDTPMIEWARSDYYDQPNKGSLGYPTAYYFDPQRAARTLYVWPVPSAAIAANTTVEYTYLRVIEDLDSLNDDFDVPQEWLEALQYSLAARLAVPYDLYLTNPVKAAKIEERAASLYAQLSSWDDEDAPVLFQPAYCP